MRIGEETTFDLGGPRAGAHRSAQFPPGTLLLRRYRLAAAIGIGGMGTVYRGYDLKIGQPVALKFLSPHLENDRDRIDRLIAEVRLGRRVTHPNVCRTYDIAEVDSHHFIVMELVEGEDLSSLLQRMGRLPEEKALGIARDVCAGLAAAHEQGIIHRDLKPGNVMIDGRGRARITDFGIASSVEDLPERHAVMGTLGYMAPEQAVGAAPTAATDVYAIGVLLYQMLTGELPHRQASIFERPAAPPIPPSSFVPDLDPRIEALIARCLAIDPAARPASAGEVLAALPQPDILDAAAEAGETPSPEIVAAAGVTGGLSRPRAWTLAAIIAICTLVGTWWFAERTPSGRLLAQLEAPQMMRARAVAIADRFAPGRVRGGREWYGYAPRDRWTSWSPAGAMRFWYRSASSAPYQRSITFDDPRAVEPGAVSIEVDGAGSLRRFRYVPRVEERAGAELEDLFAEARLDARAFAPTAFPLSGLPAVATDRLEAWRARNGKAIVLAGTLRGTPVFFDVHDDVPPMPEHPPFAGSEAALIVFLIFIVVAAVLLARRNLNAGRGDRRGAARIAVFTALTGLGSWLLIASVDKIAEGVGYACLTAMLVWLAYVALEPYARRRWPRMLISWNRLLQGRFGDPLVARDLLIGLCAAAVMRLILMYAGGLANEDSPHSARTYPSLARFLGEMIYDPFLALMVTFAFLFLFYTVAIVVRKRVLALLVVIAVLSAILLGPGGTTTLGFIAVVLVLYRFGLLAGVATCYGAFLQADMRSFAFDRWYGLPSAAAMLITAALVVWCLVHVRARRPLLSARRRLH